MEFKRTLTPNEIKLLGNNPLMQTHAIIDKAFKSLSNARDVKSVESRILSLMTTTNAMAAVDVLYVHNAMYGLTPITLSYTRYVITGMYRSGLLKRKSRGKYVKFDQEEELLKIERQITGIEMSGRITGNEKSHYDALIIKRRELRE